jgi:hypothetical protein
VAVAFLIVPGVILDMIAHTRDVGLIRKTYAIAIFHGRVGGPIALLTIILGLVIVWMKGISFTAPWLVVSYVLVVAMLALGFGYHAPREIKIAGLARSSPDTAPSPELAAAIDDPKAMMMTWISAALWTAIILVMILRPGSAP